MKKELVIAAILLLMIGYLINCRTNKGRYNELTQSNVEALANDEWGGGHNTPDGLVWYEYERIGYEYHYCGYPYANPDSLSLPECECTIKTCHGYGDLFCNGFILCY